jgi:ubiquinone/menaquinone biosynthesis C-methylase UbiE
MKWLRNLILAGVIAGAGVALIRRLARRESMPCPAWLSILLENPYMNRVAGAAALIERAGVTTGMVVLDAGCGPGRLTIPLAQRVGPDGRVVALDIQPQMLARARQKAEAAGLGHIDFVEAGLGGGRLPASTFDRAFLVTVLGEIPNREAALAEIYCALKPDGILSVTEALPDPHFQTQSAVRQLANRTGFVPAMIWKNPAAYTWHLVKKERADLPGEIDLQQMEMAI